MIQRHQSAFATRISKIFNLKPGSTFLDLTLGDGGHSQEALEAGAKVISFDVDPESISRSISFLGDRYRPQIINPDNDPDVQDFKWLIVRANFSKAREILSKSNLLPIDGIMADLGTSQYHFAATQRGFSFEGNAPLDMRLDPRLGVTASDLLMALGEKELVKLFQIADEKFAKAIAKKVVKYRAGQPIVNTSQLVSIILSVKPKLPHKIHPATKVFLSLRMAVNLERDALSSLLLDLPHMVKKGGYIGIITFHSGEDRLVKAAQKEWVSSSLCSSYESSPLVPTEQELKITKKIRSAKLRISQKI